MFPRDPQYDDDFIGPEEDFEDSAGSEDEEDSPNWRWTLEKLIRLADPPTPVLATKIAKWKHLLQCEKKAAGEHKDHVSKARGTLKQLKSRKQVLRRKWSRQSEAVREYGDYLLRAFEVHPEWTAGGLDLAPPPFGKDFDFASCDDFDQSDSDSDATVAPMPLPYAIKEFLKTSRPIEPRTLARKVASWKKLRGKAKTARAHLASHLKQGRGTWKQLKLRSRVLKRKAVRLEAKLEECLDHVVGSCLEDPRWSYLAAS